MSEGIGKLCLELAESFTLGGHGYGAKYQDPDPKKVFSIGARRHELSKSIAAYFEATDDPQIDEENKGGKLVEELEGQIDDLTEEATKLTREGEDLRVSNDALTGVVDESAESILRLEEEVNELREKVSGLEGALADADESLAQGSESPQSDDGPGDPKAPQSP